MPLFSDAEFWWSAEFLLSCFAVVMLASAWLLLTELTYVSKRLHRAMYWWVALNFRYGAKWRAKPYASAEVTRKLFLDPLREALGESADARVLDLACGSGRMSLLLLRTDWFRGRIDAFDMSGDMLGYFRHFLGKLPEEARGRVAVERGDVTRWHASPEPRYDAVALLEAGEFLPNLPAVLAEVSRSLKPGGLLLMTRPAWPWCLAFVGRRQTRRRFVRMLEEHFERVELRPWSYRYQVVHARKRGDEAAAEPAPGGASGD